MPPQLPSILTPMTKDRSSGCGCLGGGCAMAFVIFLIIGGAFGLAAWSTFKGFQGMTSATAKQIPIYSATDAEMQTVLEKAKAFNTSFDSGQEAEIVLTANEINAMIARYEPWAALSGKAYATIQGDKVNAQVSLPLSQIRLFKDRFFNGDISVTFITEKGRPTPILTAHSGDKEFPRWFLKLITSKDLVESLGVPSVSEPDSIGSNLTALEIKGDKLIVHAKKTAP